MNRTETITYDSNSLNLVQISGTAGVLGHVHSDRAQVVSWDVAGSGRSHHSSHGRRNATQVKEKSAPKNLIQ